MFVQGHKKGGHGAIGNTTGDGAQGRTSTQGLFSSLLQSIEEVAGISTTTAATSAAGTTAVTGTAAANAGAQTASVGAQTPRTGANVNTNA
jgi:hypothetical protein